MRFSAGQHSGTAAIRGCAGLTELYGGWIRIPAQAKRELGWTYDKRFIQKCTCRAVGVSLPYRVRFSAETFRDHGDKKAASSAEPDPQAVVRAVGEGIMSFLMAAEVMCQLGGHRWIDCVGGDSTWT